MLEVAAVHRHGLGPAKAEEDEGQGAHGVHAGQRVQGEAALQLGGGVPQLVGHPAVGELVQGQNAQDDKHNGKHLGQHGPDVNMLAVGQAAYHIK